MSPQRFGSDPADIRTRIRINPEIWILIPDYVWSRLWPWRRFALAEHSLCAVVSCFPQCMWPTQDFFHFYRSMLCRRKMSVCRFQFLAQKSFSNGFEPNLPAHRRHFCVLNVTFSQWKIPVACGTDSDYAGCIIQMLFSTSVCFFLIYNNVVCFIWCSRRRWCQCHCLQMFTSSCCVTVVVACIAVAGPPHHFRTRGRPITCIHVLLTLAQIATHAVAMSLVGWSSVVGKPRRSIVLYWRKVPVVCWSTKFLCIVFECDFALSKS